MAPNTLSQVAANIRVSFTQLSVPDFNGDVSNIVYRVLFLNQSSDEYVEVQSMCNASAAGILSQSYCDVTMSDLISKLGYLAGEYVMTVATASNGKGTSIASNPNSQTVQVQTSPTVSPSNILAQSLSSTSLNISWSELTGDQNTGYSAIQGYYIYHNGGSGTIFSHKITTNTYLGSTLSGLTQSTTYLLKISAYNIQGEGPLSSVLSVIAAFTPG